MKSFHRSEDSFAAEQKGDVGVSNRDPFDVVIVRSREIEEHGIAVAVKDNFAVCRAFDDNRPFERPVCREIEGAIEQREFGPA